MRPRCQVTAGEDGAVYVWDVRDKDAKAAARREQVSRWWVGRSLGWVVGWLLGRLMGLFVRWWGGARAPGVGLFGHVAGPCARPPPPPSPTQTHAQTQTLACNLLLHN